MGLADMSQVPDKRCRVARCGLEVVCAQPKWLDFMSNHRVASARRRKAAASRASRSRAKRPTIWTPRGKPAESNRPGTLMQGVPKSVHNRLKVGLPVELKPCGAAPGADVVR